MKYLIFDEIAQKPSLVKCQVAGLILVVEQNGFQIRNQHKILVYMSGLGPKLQNKSSLQLLHLCHQESEKVGVAESEIFPRKAKKCIILSCNA